MQTAASQARVRELNEYTARLRERARRFEDEVEPHVRGVIAARVYRDQAELPAVLKRAEIVARALTSVEVAILPEERIVGATSRRRRVHVGVSDPDAWRVRAENPDRHGFDPTWPVPDPAREEMRWWKGRPVNVRGMNPARTGNAWLRKYGVATPHGLIGGHTLPDHGILLSAGVAELRAGIGERLRRAESEEARDEYRAMDRCLEGLSRYCLRCADAARLKSREIYDPALKERLGSAASNCERIAEKAPASFAQALQLLYFSNFVDSLDNPGDAFSFGRIDQLLLPYYRRDIHSGALTDDEAFDLVCHFVIKCWGPQNSRNMTVGGVDAEGRDATNDLSFMFLEAMEATGMATDISVRLHGDPPPGLVRTAARVLRRGLGRPSLYNDGVAIEALVRKGVEIKDARDYAPLGCAEVMIPGRSAFRTMCMDLNLAKVLELTLNEGRCLVTGDVVWDDVPREFGTFEAFLAEYRARVRHVVQIGVNIIREDERLEPRVFPRPWLTVLSRGGIESGLDVTAGQPKYDPVGATLTGVADVSNSLCALKRLVFDEKRLTLDELRAVLRDDWEGHEALRQRVLNRYPRFGQDDPEVDEIARAEAAHYAACFEGHETYYGGRFWPMVFGVATALLFDKGPKTGATPSGRKSGTILAMSLTPSPAGPQGALTAILRSAASIDSLDFPGGISNVQECDPSLVSGEEGLTRLVNLILGFFELGGMELSLNFLSEEKLRAAQADPDRHRYLMVRLFGLSAQFVNLSGELQESVIERVAAARQRTSAAGVLR